MPDIQTALSNALKNKINQWEKEEMQTTTTNTKSEHGANYQKGKKAFSVTNNVTRETFDFVKANPNLTSPEICAEMTKRGFKDSSVSSLIAQFAVQGLAERDDRGRYLIIVNEYRPLKSKKKAPTVVAKPVVEAAPKRKYEKKGTTGIGALLREKLENTPMPSQDAMDAAAYAMTGHRPVLTKLVRTQAPEDIIGNMTVYQARDLYMHLKSMFGG
jgi:hypothetical protein